MIHDLTMDKITGYLDGLTLIHTIQHPGRVATICADDGKLFNVQIFASERIMKLLHIHTFETPLGRRELIAEEDTSIDGFRADREKPNVIVCRAHGNYWRKEVQIKLVEEQGGWESAYEYYNDVFKENGIYIEPKEDKGATE